MKTKNFTILITIFLLIGCVSKKEKQVELSTTQDSSSTKKSTQSQTPTLLTFNYSAIDSLFDKEVNISKVDSNSYPDFTIFYFEFSSNSYQSYRDYGRGIALVKDDSLVAWNLEYGDYTSHTHSWLDFDNDGDKDLYTYAGEEKVFSSKLYLIEGNSFKMVYENKLTYCPIIDIDKDGIPEILNTKSSDVIEVGYDNELHLTQAHYDRISDEYDSIVGDFDKHNYDYNMPEVYKLFSLNILSSVNILKLVGGKLEDVSTDNSEHFCFRIDLLQSIESPSKRVEAVINNLSTEYEKICKK